MVLVPASPNRRARSQGPSPSNPLSVSQNGRVTRHALNSLAWWQMGASRRHKLRHLDVPESPYYVALRAALNARPAPPSPPRSSTATRIRCRRRPAAPNENNNPSSTSSATSSASTSTASTSTTFTSTTSTTTTSTSRASTAVAAPWMRQTLPVPPSSLPSFISTPQQRGILSSGSRVRNNPPLTLTSLWIDGIEPPVLTTPERPHQECAICKHVKCCPVISGCGHSHCYPCIRLWLERSFQCPTCRTVMTSPPFRCWTEEQSILFDNPNWNNTSRVDYSFEGLTFPHPM
ncbi:hypothetical protein B0H13DRAFT_2336973 [Mycena leptocephala]|nr:hypothetical protein B0H13DRAFT_2336973 [Mycena leptocephala]